MSQQFHALGLYLDTSAIGGYFDPEFMGDTCALSRHRDADRFRFITSQLVFQEIADALEQVRTLMRATFGPKDVLEHAAEVEELTQAYLAQKIVPPDYDDDDDVRHVAICAVARIGYLVSWNFKHLANVRRESAFNEVNLLRGYPSLRMVAPTFLIHGDHQEKDV